MAVQNPVQAREQRATAALEDVVDVRSLAPGMFEVQTLSDVYQVDIELGVCYCPDFEFNSPPKGRCKHLQRARIEAGETPVPTNDQDAGDCDRCGDDFPCFDHFGAGEAE